MFVGLTIWRILSSILSSGKKGILFIYSVFRAFKIFHIYIFQNRYYFCSCHPEGLYYSKSYICVSILNVARLFTTDRLDIDRLHVCTHDSVFSLRRLGRLQENLNTPGADQRLERNIVKRRKQR